jgi:hypothetical protein
LLNYFKNHQINYQKWNECINNSSQAIIYGLSWYLDIVKPNWEAIIYQNNTQYLAVMPLPVCKKLTISHIYQPLFAQQLGVFSTIPLTSELAQLFIKKLNLNFDYVAKYAFNTQNVTLLNQVQFQNIQTKLLTTHHLDLSNSYSTLHQNYHLDRKQRLKKAQKKEIKIIESQNISPLIEMFKKNTQTKIKGGVAEKTYEILENLHRELVQRKMCRLFYSEDLNAGCYFAFYKNKIIYLFNAAENQARSQNARTLILDKIIQEYAQTDYILDFESPEIKTIADFYASFGAKATNFHFISYNHLPFLIRKAQEFKKNILKKNKR